MQVNTVVRLARALSHHHPARRCKRPVTAAAAALILLAPGSPAIAGEESELNARGFSAEKAYAVGEIDHVNLHNGNLTLTLPLGQRYPVGMPPDHGGFTYGFTLVYNSMAWDIAREYVGPNNDLMTWPVPARSGNAGLGWTLTLGLLLPPGYDPEDPTEWTYVSPDGAKHVLRHPDLVPGHDDGSDDTVYTGDGSYIRMTLQPDGRRTLELADGTIHTFSDHGSPEDPDWRLDEIADRVGNHLDLSYTGSAGVESWSLTDSEGRSHEIELHWDAETGWTVDTLRLAAFGGATATYTFVYESTWVDACYRRRLDPPVPDSLLVPLLVRVEQPHGLRYEMTANGAPWYATTCDEDGIAGALRGLKLPTLGSIAWDYGRYVLPASSLGRGASWETISGVIRRRTLDAQGATLGTWEYTSEPITRIFEPDEGPVTVESRTYVRDPSGTCTKNYFSGPAESWAFGLPFANHAVEPSDFVYGNERYELSTEVWTDTEPVPDPELFDPRFRCGGGKLRTTYAHYVANGSDIDSNRRLQRSATRYDDDGGEWTLSRSDDFDGLGHYRFTYTTASAGFPGPPSRETTRDYNPDRGTYPQTFTMLPASEPWLIQTYGFERRYVDPSDWVEERLCFDEAGLAIQRRTVHSMDPGGTAADVIVATVLDHANGRATVRSYGGQVQQQMPTDGDLCPDLSALPPQYEVVNEYDAGALARSFYLEEDGTPYNSRAVDRDIDLSTGLPAASRDSAGLRTTYGYDRLGRLKLAQPETGHGARADYSYIAPEGSTPPSVVARQRTNDGATILTQQRFEYDALGRLWRESRRLPEQHDAVRETLYDALGRKRSVSEWGLDAPATGVTQFQYDPFGRPTEIVGPDGAVQQTDYRGVRRVHRTVSVATSPTAEEPSTRREVYDRLGRLSQVKEPSAGSGDCSQDPLPAACVTWTYLYDAADRLIQVVNSDNGQTRYFIYNRVGNLERRRGAEEDPWLASWFGDYDALGNPGYAEGVCNAPVTDCAGSTWRFGQRRVYDRAGRLIQVWELGQHPEYGQDERLLKEFTYADTNQGDDLRQGKLVKAVRHNYHPATGTDTEIREVYKYEAPGGRVSARFTYVDGVFRFKKDFTWTELGDADTVRYAGAPERIVDYEYEWGRLSAVVGYADAITYHPNGLPALIEHANSVDDLWDNDPHGMARPLRIRSEGPAGTAFDTGPYAYDGAGNIEAIGGNVFTYDLVSRLTSATVQGNPRTYAYDPLGNLLPPPPYDIDEWSNQLYGAGVGYDPAGRLTRLGDVRFDYDAAGMPSRRRVIRPGCAHPLVDETYVYTADDERIASTVLRRQPALCEPPVGAGTTWRVRGLDGKVLREFSGTFEVGLRWETDWIWRDDQLLAADDAALGLYHHHLDHLGTPRLLTNADGSVRTRFEYYPFGERIDGSLHPEVMRFTAHERDFGAFDAHGDLDYMHARSYTSKFGRFLAVDPSRESQQPRQPQSWNRYSYTRNSPLKYVDPDGRLLDAAVDLGLIAYDLFDIGRSLVRGEGVSLTQGLALAADIVGAAIPGATGLGAGVRALRGADNVVGVTRAVGGAARGGVVIGENMGRVQRYADEIGAETFKGTGMAENRAFIQQAVREGKEVLDIGPDFSRRLTRTLEGQRPDSPFYNMERMETRAYDAYQRLFERSGRFEGGVPGLDY